MRQLHCGLKGPHVQHSICQQAFNVQQTSLRYSSRTRALESAAHVVAKEEVYATNVATYSSAGHQQQGSVACFTTEPQPAISSSEWTCHSSVAAHDRHQNGRLPPSMPLHAQPLVPFQHQLQDAQSLVPVVAAADSADQAQQSAAQQDQLQQQQQDMQQHTAVMQAADASMPAAQLEQQQQQQQQRQQPLHVEKQRLTKQRQRQQQQQLLLSNSHPAESWLVHVANSTNPAALATHLLKRHKHSQHKWQQQQGNPAGTSSSEAVTLSCSSSRALHAALCAVGFAATQAAALPQPQQLLLQPQLLRNALEESADGRCGMAAYQLHLCWVPAPQQQQQLQEQLPPVQQQQLQEVRESSSSSSSSDTGQSLGIQQLRLLSCDLITSSNPSSNHSSSSSSSRQQPPGVRQLAQQVCGLLKGGWHVGLTCSSAPGALLAVKSLVTARRQLAAAGLDLMLAVDAAAAAPAGGVGDEVALLTLHVLSVPAMPADAMLQQQQQQHADVLAVPSVERVLARQQQERTRARKLRARLAKQQASSQQQQQQQQVEQEHEQQLQPDVLHHQQQQQHAVPAGIHSSLEGVLYMAAPATRQQQQQQSRPHRRPGELGRRQQEALSSMLAEAAAAAVAERPQNAGASHTNTVSNGSRSSSSGGINGKRRDGASAVAAAGEVMQGQQLQPMA